MIRRRFVNLVVDNYSTGERSLHRLDAVKHLFYPSTAKAEAAHDAKKNNNGVRTPPEIGTLRRLPPPTMHLGTFPTSVHPCCLEDTFMLLSHRTSDGRILHANSKKGLTHIYDAGAGSTTVIPTLQRWKGGRPIMISIGGAGTGAKEEGKERVYVMSNYCCDDSFEVLDFSQHPHKWEPLPLLPCAKSYDSNIRSFTVVDGGSTICVSTESIGTYCFDTRSHEWRKAGDWKLPFLDQAEYVPELETWLGFSLSHFCFKPKHLCASSDLSAMDAQREPKLQHVWEDLNPPSEEEFLELGGNFQGTVLKRSVNWYPYGQHLVNLGGGRFCIAKVFQVQQEITLHFEGDTTVGEEFVILIGVEVVRGGDNGEDGLRMVKHKSKRYVFTSDRIRCVL
ncbi:unnamed protein product [Urochloa decumbens]|uniref:Uncharacterized protein n=1 Tax=Urochloa decumbens TaxID=240449 RepID=A0ABC9GDJ0_9POAL